MHKPLDGIRVLEWGVFHAGPGACAILADLGAEVIKIEQRGVGDPVRKFKRYKGIDFSLPHNNVIFNEVSNRGKKSLTLNLAHPEGKQIAYNLASKSDIFVTNLRRSTVEKMKMDYSSLSKVNPKIIYTWVSSYGSRGPDADAGGFDYQGQGRSGMMYCLGEPGMPPMLGQFGIIDQATAIMASYQMMIALWMRERFGIGQEVEVSLLGTASYMLYFNNLTALLTGKEIPRHEQADADPLRNYYLCKDGKWVIQNQPAGEAYWLAVCKLLDHPELGDDPRYNNREKRLRFSRELVSVFDKAFAARTRDEWLRLFAEEKLVLCSVNTITEAVNDPQMIANGYIIEAEHPELGHIRMPGYPAQFSRAQIRSNAAAPKLGEHTESILKEIGGYSDEDCARFRAHAII